MSRNRCRDGLIPLMEMITCPLFVVRMSSRLSVDACVGWSASLRAFCLHLWSPVGRWVSDRDRDGIAWLDIVDDSCFVRNEERDISRPLIRADSVISFRTTYECHAMDRESKQREQTKQAPRGSRANSSRTRGEWKNKRDVCLRTRTMIWHRCRVATSAGSWER